MRPTVYLSGPITNGDRQANFDQAADAQNYLMGCGCAIQNPMLSMKLPGAWDIPHETWIQNDLPFIANARGRVDAVLRLPGYSPGADVECSHAVLHGVPVYHDVVAMLEDLGLSE